MTSKGSHMNSNSSLKNASQHIQIIFKLQNGLILQCLSNETF